MQVHVDLVEESPPATPVPQINRGPDFVRPKSLCPAHLFSSHWSIHAAQVSVQQGGYMYYKCTVFFRSVTAWLLEQRGLRVRGMEWHFSCWYGVSPVGVCLKNQLIN